MSITLELSPEIEKQLAAMSAEELTRFVADAVQEKIEALEEEEDEFTLTPYALESIGRGLAQADAGELIDGDEVIAELFASVGLENPPTFNAGNPRAALRKTVPLSEIKKVYGA